MKIAAWNCQGAGNEAFCTHAHELYHLHLSQILIIVEPRIADEHAQAIKQNSYYKPNPKDIQLGFKTTKVPNYICAQRIKYILIPPIQQKS